MAVHTKAEIESMNLICPACQKADRHGNLVPMFKASGLRCNTPGNRPLKINGKFSWSVCNYVVWLQEVSNDPTGTLFILRPSEFPKIATPTYEQLPIRNWFGAPPHKKGGRLLLINAGPGCGKSTSVAWSAEAAYDRLGTLDKFEFIAFNRNAKDVLFNKLPHQVTGIYTLNGLGMRLQGYRSDDIDDQQVLRIFNRLIENIKPDDRPPFDGMDEIISRMRAFCLYNDPDNTKWWTEAITATVERFGMLEGVRNPQEALERWITYVPRIMAESLKSNKIDLDDQWSRAVIVAMTENNLFLPAQTVSRDFVMNDDFIDQLADICRKVDLPHPKGLVIDEGQDLCLGQIVFYVSAAYRSSELVVIGDDKNGQPSDPDYKAGQGIFGRLWERLTGEKPTELPLSITFRSAPEVVEAFRPLNKTLKSAKPKGSGFAYAVPANSAFDLWCGMPENINVHAMTAFWITRTNKASGEIFMKSIKARVQVTFRGGNNFEKSLDAILYNSTADADKKQFRIGRDFKTGEYPGVNLMDARNRMEKAVQEIAEKSEERAADMMEQFLVSVIDEMIADPTVLEQVQGLPHYNLTLGNLRRFLMAFAGKNAPRIVSNVYRVKGEESDWVFVGDCTRFNESWGGDADEAAACRLVACSRAATGLIITGALAGVTVDPITEEQVQEIPQNEERAKIQFQKEAFKKNNSKVKMTKVRDGFYTWKNYEVEKKTNKLWYIRDTKKTGVAGEVGPMKTMAACQKYLEGM